MLLLEIDFFLNAVELIDLRKHQHK